MDSQEFVDAVRHVVGDGAVSATLMSLERPPGRAPARELKERSDWFASLDEDGRRILASTIRAAVEQAVFGFLCVLDGVSAIENQPKKGRLELFYVKDAAVRLNPTDGPMLHDLL
jgi:hypothetical protein